MGRGAFTGQAAKAEVTAAIRAIENITSAEVVVAVRASSGHYRHTDYLVGAAASFVALLVFLFDPEHEFSLEWMPVDSIVAFVLGAVLSANVAPLRRWLTSRKLMRSNVASAARAAFFDLRISRTSERTGILVFVSMLEKRVEVVPDVGVDRAVLGAPFSDAVAALDAAVRRGPSFPTFLDALRSLGPVLGKVLPRRAGDVNELPDEPST